MITIQKIKTMEVLIEKTVRKSRKSSTKTSKAEATLEEAKDIIKNGYVLLEDYFEVPVGVYELLNRNIRKAKNTLILGPTGLGKTELIYNLAKHNNMEITIFDMGTMTDAISGLVGTHIITVKDGLTTSKFCKSRFSEAIQKKGIILLDELNR